MNILRRLKPLRVLIAFPRYRFLWACAEDFEADLILAAAQSGGEVVLGRYPARHLTGLHVESARERACAYAVEKGFDVLVMGDADAGFDGADGLALAKAAHDGNFALLAAPFCQRGGEDLPNFNPWEDDERRRVEPTPEELRELATAVRDGLPYTFRRGFMATTVSAYATKALRNIPRPWFHRPLEDEDAGDRGLRGRTTEDVFFGRRARVAGEKIGIHFGLRSGVHWEGVGRRSVTMLANLSRTLQEEIRRSGGSF